MANSISRFISSIAKNEQHSSYSSIPQNQTQSSSSTFGNKTMHNTISPAILYWGTPVVLITTENEDGTFNICPMSSAWWLAHRCMIGLAAMSKTTQNLLRTRRCVLNLATEEMTDHINALARTTGTDPPPEWKTSVGYSFVKDKFGHAGLTPQKSDLVAPPRIKECPVQMEAELMDWHEMMKDLPDRKGVVFGMELKILRVHVEDDLRLAGHANRIDTDKWHPLMMCFQEYYGMGKKKLTESRLAHIEEENYRVLTRSDVVKQGADTDAVVTDRQAVIAVVEN
jgi:flavin reductase (DIM6/NTAB) family NADH-FMN oxidoreductase RutF